MAEKEQGLEAVLLEVGARCRCWRPTTGVSDDCLQQAGVAGDRNVQAAHKVLSSIKVDETMNQVAYFYATEILLNFA